MPNRSTARRRAAVAAATLGLASMASILAPATANAGPTTVTFTIAAGALTITNPAAANIGAGSPGGVASGQLGTVTVTDQRAALAGAWTASVISTAFTTGTGTADETVPALQVTYASGTATATSGGGVFVPGQVTGVPVPIATPTVAFARTGVGNSSASWNPTLTVILGPQAVSGTYTGTVTHSVA